ncbi:beta-ketoacyl-ACP synthase [Methylomonas sp. SURF-2]|uniref:Beta-ketoacyl-ACP synthase n=1 Tax=Methylomonas subterranea TaxID=2952225 RepID=A0ABT1TJI6_9GAMM|nr:beta-ketoacyl-ACP synthase [Methylomonas sp. SURF-2]MCQ8105408.1 beta-ketoacyl-ACP synthase [Methylomonas sp. SURF-2]
MNRRVVVTGMAGFSPIGNDWAEIRGRLSTRRSGIRYMTDWDKYNGLLTRLGGPVENFDLPAHYTRKNTRSMGRVALLATRATELALSDAGLLGDPLISGGRTGVSYGSSVGSTSAVADFGKMLIDHDIGNLNATTYLKMMGHTTTANVAVFFQTRGRIIPAVSACTSGSQGIGFAYEAIKFGQQDVMLAGGAEELCPTMAALFDALYATSTRNQAPESTPRPFDRDRDGLVIGEGACTLVLEELGHALARGAHIYAEVAGFATNADGAHVTQPNADTMQIVMRLALRDAGLEASQIAYISAHGTATEQGDIAESHATAAVFGPHTPLSSLKGYTGHTLGACGALEAMVAIRMMREGWFHPNLNLEHIDSRCAELDYISGAGRDLAAEYVMSNNFAFGGINTSLIFRRWQDR